MATRLGAEDAALAARALEPRRREQFAALYKACLLYKGMTNALGVPLYVRSGDGATVVKARPGEPVPFVGRAVAGPGPGPGPVETRPDAENAKTFRENDDARYSPTYLIVEVLETRNAAVFDTARFELLDSALDAESASVAATAAGETTGAAMLDVGEWRARVRREKNELGQDAALEVRVSLEPSLLSLLSFGATPREGDAARDGGGATVTFPAAELLAASADPRDGGWYPSRDGVWVDERKKSAESGKAGKALRVRARIAEGLDLTPPRDVPPGGDDDGDGDGSTRRAATYSEHDDSFAGENLEDAEETFVTSSGETRLVLRRAPRLNMTWSSKNSGASDFSAWTPACPPGFAALGTTVVASFAAPAEALVAPAPWLLASGAQMNSANAAARPATKPATGFASAFRDSGSRLRKNPKTGTFAVWRPIAPEGYVALGCVVTPTHDPPDPDRVACVRADLAVLSTPAPAPLWTTEGAESKLGAEAERVPHRRRRRRRLDGPSPTGTRGVHGRARAALGRGARRARRRRQRGRRGRRRADGWLGRWKTTRPARVRAVGGRDRGRRRGRARSEGVAVAADVRRRRRVRGGGRPARGVRARAGDARRARRAVPLLEARLVRVNGGGSLSRAESSAAAAAASFAAARVSPVVEVFESERFFPLAGWREPRSPFDEFFTARYGDARGADSASHFRDVPLPEGWRWVGPWTVDRDHDVDDKGWAYGVNWVTRWPPPRGSHKRGLNATRRRRWTRRRALIGDDSTRSDASASSVDGVTSWRGAPRRHSLTTCRAAGFATRGSPSSEIGRGAGSRRPRTGPASSRRHGYGDMGAQPPPGRSALVAGSESSRSCLHRGVARARRQARDRRRQRPVAGAFDPKRNERNRNRNRNRARDARAVAVTAERDPDVASAAGVDALGGDACSAWRLVARAPRCSLALPCALQFQVVRDADGPAAAGVARPGRRRASSAPIRARRRAWSSCLWMRSGSRRARASRRWACSARRARSTRRAQPLRPRRWWRRSGTKRPETTKTETRFRKASCGWPCRWTPRIPRTARGVDPARPHRSPWTSALHSSSRTGVPSPCASPHVKRRASASSSSRPRARAGGDAGSAWKRAEPPEPGSGALGSARSRLAICG